MRRTSVLFRIGCLSLLVFNIGCGRYKPNNELLTVKNIMAVRPGMTMEQVKSILGNPVEEIVKDEYSFHCKCNPEGICREKAKYIFQYTKRLLSFPYPMVWVHFNSRKKVTEVYVKKYTLWDDPGIYAISNNPCDTTDPIIPFDSTNTYSKNNGLKEFFK